MASAKFTFTRLTAADRNATSIITLDGKSGVTQQLLKVSDAVPEHKEYREYKNALHDYLVL